MPDHRVHEAPDFETLVADIEIALFEVLERRLRQVLGMAGQMDLAIAPDDMPGRIDQNRGVVMALLALLLGQFGITEIEPDPEFLREIEERPGCRIRHIALEPAVDFLLIGHPPARKKRRQRQFGKDNKPRAVAVRLAQQRAEPDNDRLAAVGAVNGTELRHGGAQLAGHLVSPGNG